MRQSVDNQSSLRHPVLSDNQRCTDHPPALAEVTTVPAVKGQRLIGALCDHIIKEEEDLRGLCDEASFSSQSNVQYFRRLVWLQCACFEKMLLMSSFVAKFHQLRGKGG